MQAQHPWECLCRRLGWLCHPGVAVQHRRKVIHLLQITYTCLQAKSASMCLLRLHGLCVSLGQKRCSKREEQFIPVWGAEESSGIPFGATKATHTEEKCLQSESHAADTGFSIFIIEFPFRALSIFCGVRICRGHITLRLSNAHPPQDRNTLGFPAKHVLIT